MNAILVCQDRIGRHKGCETIFLGVWNSGCLLVDMRCIFITRIFLRVIICISIGVSHQDCQARSGESLREERDFLILLHHVWQHAVAVFQHLAHRLHDTILYRVILQLIDDVRCSVKKHYGIAILVQSMSHLYITTVHVRSGDNTRVHVRGSIHVADEMGASDRIAVGLREFVHRT